MERWVFQKMGKMGMMGKMGFKDGKDGFFERWERWVPKMGKMGFKIPKDGKDGFQAMIFTDIKITNQNNPHISGARLEAQNFYFSLKFI